jgi:hypothetical protein
VILAIIVVRKRNAKAVSIDIGAAVGAAEYNLLVGVIGQIGVVHVTDYVIGLFRLNAKH